MNMNIIFTTHSEIQHRSTEQARKRFKVITLLIHQCFVDRQVMSMCTLKQKPYGLFDVREVAIICNREVDLPALSTLLLRQCLIMGSVSDNWSGAAWQPSRIPLNCLCDTSCQSPSLSFAGRRCVSRHVFQWNWTPAGNLAGFSRLLSAGTSPSVEGERLSWQDGVRENRRERRQPQWGDRL